MVSYLCKNAYRGLHQENLSRGDIIGVKQSKGGGGGGGRENYIINNYNNYQGEAGIKWGDKYHS